MAFSHHNRGQVSCSETSAQSLGRKISASFRGKGKMRCNKFIQMGAILILSVLLTPSGVFSYTVLWDTSHGIANSGQYQPSGYYQALSEHLSDNGFTTVTTSQGFLIDPMTYLSLYLKLSGNALCFPICWPSTRVASSLAICEHPVL